MTSKYDSYNPNSPLVGTGSNPLSSRQQAKVKRKGKKSRKGNANTMDVGRPDRPAPGVRPIPGPPLDPITNPNPPVMRPDPIGTGSGGPFRPQTTGPMIGRPPLSGGFKTRNRRNRGMSY